MRIVTVFCLFIVCFLQLHATDTVIYVSETNGEGVLKAVRAAREYRRRHEPSPFVFAPKAVSAQPAATIRLARGVYRFSEPLRLLPEDSNLSIVGEDGTVFSGGIPVTGWKQEGKCWVTEVPDFNGRPFEFRQLWVNGRKAVRARDVADFEQMNRIRWVDREHRTLWVPASAVRNVRFSLLGEKYAEMVLHEMWCVAVLRIKDIRIDGDSAGVTFCDPESRVQFEHPWPSPMFKSAHNSPFYLTNSSVLLDEPGEWYHDIRQHKLYYYPLPDESLEASVVEVPALETLVEVTGTRDYRVSGIRFSNITFSHSTWLRPSFEGHVPLQVGMYLTDAYRLCPKRDRADNHKLDNQGWLGRAAAAVQVVNGDDIRFDHCQFTHLGGSGLDYVEGCAYGGVTDCAFTDIAMNGLVAGSFSPSALETHLPYRPSDAREICHHQQVSNCLFADVGNDDWGCVAIAAGYVNNISIEHNEIHDVPYTGISLGWGWNRDSVCMFSNRVHANLIYRYAGHMYDTAGIYTLGNQPGTEISENVVRDICRPTYVHDPNHWFYLYTDEGSSHITFRDNWTPSEKYLKNANGPGNRWINNGPQVDEHVRLKAGRLRNGI